MERKSFFEDTTFRYIGLSIGITWLVIGVVIASAFYLQIPARWLFSISIIQAVSRLAFMVWVAVFLWRWYGGYYKRDEPTNDSAALSRRRIGPISNLLIWVGIAFVLVLAFNFVPDIVQDKHFAELILKVGPLVLLVAGGCFI
ncbi:MAG: hypothetical protein WCA81_07485 [Rhizomicrobium sp.]